MKYLNVLVKVKSFLYNVLIEFDKTFCEENRNSRTNSLYANRALYSPDVIFFKDDKSSLADVLTCAAPNCSNSNVSKSDNSNALKKRIVFVLDIASNKNVNILILGAWGCGVFGQDPSEVAKLFVEELKNHKDIENIIFAIVDKESKNYRAFEQVI